MAGMIWEFFGYRAEDKSNEAKKCRRKSICPIIDETCEKTINDGTVSGVCSIKPITTDPVICCPVRLYAEDYKILRDVSTKAFGEGLPLVPCRKALSYAKKTKKPCVAVFGKRWGV